MSGRDKRGTMARLAVLALPCALAACGGGHRAETSYRSAPNYAPPGPPSDPWGPYIGQASRRFDVPQPWIRTVIRQESGGHQYMHGQPTTSDAGAMGLMQLMPATYGELAARFGLGQDPYEPHDNIMAGTGYIKDLYGQFGSPAFLAAYNAGPHRVKMYLAGHGSLPNETVNYLASAAPHLGNERPSSGPLAAFADAAPQPTPAPVLHDYVQAPSARCWQDPDAAYDPTAPCRSAPPVQVASVFAPAQAAYNPPVVARVEPVALPGPSYAVSSGQSSARCWQDPDAAYDPTAPCRRAPPARRPSVVAAAAPAQAPYRFAGNLQVSRQLVASAQGAPIRRAMATGRWAIQVGAYATPGQARQIAESVRSLAPAQLGGAQAVLGATAPFGGQVMYRARLRGLSAENAAAACRDLRAAGQACVAVAPGA